ncbi:MAG: hypothetical protein AAFQ67_09220, partial [Pseudomonadota bacterium]
AQMAVGFLPLMAGDSGVDPAILSEVSASLASFLANPGVIEVKLNPETPIALGDVSDPSLLTKETLGFSMTTSN